MRTLAVLSVMIGLQCFAGNSVKVSEGRSVIPGTWEWDLEHNALGSCTPDFWFERMDETESHLIPVPGVRVAVLKDKDYDDIDYNFIKAFRFPPQNAVLTNKGDDLALKPGTVLIVRTSQNHLAKVLVHGYFNSHAVKFGDANVLMPFLNILLSRAELKYYHMDVQWALYGDDTSPSEHLGVWKKECEKKRVPASTPESFDIKGAGSRNVGAEALKK